MSCLQIPLFNEMIQTLSADLLFKKAVSQAESHYMVKPLGLQTLTPASVIQLINRNFDKTNVFKTAQGDEGDCLNQTVWALNEFKLFAWVSVCYAYIEEKEFQKFSTEDYEFLQSLFTRKSTTFLEYHLRNLLKENKKIRQKWNQEQIDLLIKVIKQEGFTFKWSEISYKLFEQSQKKYFRTPQKCREKWFNHLDPIVNRQKWTLEQDLSLFNNIIRFGSKWAMISKLFNNSRTEHMIKNRYHSLMKKYQAKTNRMSTKKLMEKIHEDLSYRFNGIKHEQSENSVEDIIKEEVEEKPLEEVELHPKISNASDTNEEKAQQIRRETFAKQMKKLRSFDLQQVLFSQSTIEIQEPARTLGQVELIEVEMFAELPGGDEYLSLLF